MGVWCFSGFSSLFPLIVAALYWRRFTKAGAYAGIIAAFGSWAVLFYMSGFGKNPHFDVFGTMPVATMVLCSTLAVVLVSLVTRPPTEATLAKFFPAKE
jgi:SSS family solute:Na+ symporter